MSAFSRATRNPISVLARRMRDRHVRYSLCVLLGHGDTPGAVRRCRGGTQHRTSTLPHATRAVEGKPGHEGAALGFHDGSRRASDREHERHSEAGQRGRPMRDPRTMGPQHARRCERIIEDARLDRIVPPAGHAIASSDDDPVVTTSRPTREREDAARRSSYSALRPCRSIGGSESALRG